MFEHLEKQNNKEETPPAGNSQPESDLVLRNTIERLTGSRVSVSSPFIATTHALEKRLRKLEEKGRKRGKRFSVIGIAGGFALALIIMYFSHLIWNDVIRLSGEAGKSSEGGLINIRNDADRSFKKASSSLNVHSGELQELLSDPVEKENIDSASSSLEKNSMDNASSSAESGLSSAVADSDNDGLSDNDEAIKRTNPNIPDTDGDGYLDGEEVRNGYDPLTR